MSRIECQCIELSRIELSMFRIVAYRTVGIPMGTNSKFAAGAGAVFLLYNSAGAGYFLVIPLVLRWRCFFVVYFSWRWSFGTKFCWR